MGTVRQHLTRPKWIQLWFSAVALIVVFADAFGARASMETGVLLAAASLVPPLVLFMMWPAERSPSAADMSYRPDGRDRRLAEFQNTQS